MQKRRVVVTGLGIVSPLGSGVENFWKAMVNGQSGVALITKFDASQFDAKIAAEVKDALLAYCRQDTLAMAKILERLRAFSLNR